MQFYKQKWEDIKWWHHKNYTYKTFGIGWDIQKQQDEKSSLSENQPISANYRGDISSLILDTLYKSLE